MRKDIAKTVYTVSRTAILPVLYCFDTSLNANKFTTWHGHTFWWIVVAQFSFLIMLL